MKSNHRKLNIRKKWKDLGVLFRRGGGRKRNRTKRELGRGEKSKIHKEKNKAPQIERVESDLIGEKHRETI